MNPIDWMDKVDKVMSEMPTCTCINDYDSVKARPKKSKLKMIKKERFVFYPTSNYILDRETEHTYFCNNRRVCILLNELNDKMLETQESAIGIFKENNEIWKILRKYNIHSIEKLDQVLLNERTW